MGPIDRLGTGYVIEQTPEDARPKRPELYLPTDGTYKLMVHSRRAGFLAEVYRQR